MSKRLTGLNPLAYMGVEPLSPAQTYNQKSDPTVNDFQGFNLGDVWVNQTGQRVWIYLGQNTQREAVWLEMAASGTVGASDFITDSGTAITNPSGDINVVGGSNINTAGATNTVTVNLDDNVTISGNFSTTAGNIEMIQTNAAGTAGVITVGGNPTFYTYDLSDNPSSNTFLGVNVGNPTFVNMTGGENTVLGAAAGISLTSGGTNTLVGFQCGQKITTGTENIFIGSNTGSVSTAITGDNNIALGQGCYNGLTSGSNNITIGNDGLSDLTTGSNNIFIGGDIGIIYTTESNNIIINNTGVASDANTIRIGTQGSSAGQQNKCFIAGIRGVTTVNDNAVAVLVDSEGQLGTVSSSRVYKENIVDMRSQSEAILSMRPVTFNYKSDERKYKQYGLIAEEVAEVMPDLVVYDEDGAPETIKYHLLIPLLLNEVQRLNERMQDKCACNCRS